MIRALGLVVALVVGLASPAAALHGDLDGGVGFVGRIGLPGQAMAAVAGPEGSTIAAVRNVDEHRLVTISRDGAVRPLGSQPASISITALALDLHGGILAVGTVAVAGDIRAAVQRFELSGDIDRTFGTDGVVQVAPADQSSSAWSVLVRGDGSAYVTGVAQEGLSPGCVRQNTFVSRVTAAGQLDPSFDDDGTVLLDIGRGDGSEDKGTGLAFGEGGGVVVSVAYTSDVRTGSHCVALEAVGRGALVAFNADGSANTAFGYAGVSPLPDRVAGLASTRGGVLAASDPGGVTWLRADGVSFRRSPSAAVGQVVPWGDGSVTVVGTSTQTLASFRASRLGAGGTPDQTFGACGTAVLPLQGVGGVAAFPDESLVVVGGDLAFRLQGPQDNQRPAPVRTNGGAWAVAADGGVFTSGDALFCRSTGGIRLNQPIVGISSIPSRNGYRFVAADGGVFTFGHATYHGSTGGIRLNQPIVGMASTPTGDGYWLVARDGGIFSFGDAVFHGSTGAIRLAQPIVGMAATASGRGYWLVAADGGVFAFGDAPFLGSTAGMRLAQPIVGIGAQPSGRGYWLVAHDGGLFSFGEASYGGSPAGPIGSHGPTVGIAVTSTGRGYWTADATGRVDPWGDATGELPPMRLARPLVGIAPG